MKAKKTLNKKQKTKKIIIGSIAVGAAGILGYFGWQYFKKKKQSKKCSDLDESLKTASTSSAINFDIPSYSSPKTSSTTKPKTSSTVTPSYTPEFPLKRGSKGEKVRLLQEAIISKYGKSYLPKYGADSDFGLETANALKKLNLPATIDESTFNVLVQSSSAASSNPTSFGKDLYKAAIAKDFNKVMSLLKQMKSKDDYTAANEVFKTYRINGVRQTIVNGLLNSFSRDDQKQKIKFEFLRMGLQFDGNKWSLSGFDGKSIVTLESTTVWVNATEGVKVPPKMVLGNEVSRRLDYTLFENNGKYFLVNTKSVQYL